MQGCCFSTAGPLGVPLRVSEAQRKGPILKGFKGVLILGRARRWEEGMPFVLEPNPRT